MGVDVNDRTSRFLDASYHHQKILGKDQGWWNCSTILGKDETQKIIISNSDAGSRETILQLVNMKNKPGPGLNKVCGIPTFHGYFLRYPGINTGLYSHKLKLAGLKLLISMFTNITHPP